MNAFTNFKNRYAGTKTAEDRLTQATSNALLKAYENLWSKIYVEVTEARKDPSYTSLLKQNALIKQISKLIAGFKGDASDIMSRSAKLSADLVTKIALKDLSYIGGASKHKASWHYEFNRSYAENVFNDNFEHIAAQTDKMLYEVKTALRQESMKVLRLASVEGLSRKEASKQIAIEMKKSVPDFRFIDKRGRAWNNETYFEMLSRTVMHNTMRESYVNTLTNEGKDLVIVSSHNAEDECSNWEGEVLSLTGATEGYPTLDDAIASGEIFHPRCAHVLLAYDEKIDDVFEKLDKEVEEEE